MGYYIEYNTIGKSEKERETIATADLKNVLYRIAIKRFSGIANVYEETVQLFSMNCEQGILNGKFVKYCEYVPSTTLGYLSGVISRNWRQPEIELSLRSGLVDGQVVIYFPDGSRHYLLNFSMGLLQGNQKHYTTSVTRILHKYDKDVWISTEKEYKNWLPRWGVELDEFASHKEIKMTSMNIKNMFVR